MFYRKIEKRLEKWKSDNLNGLRYGLTVVGLRQVGKTTLIEEFVKTNFKSHATINFKDSPKFKKLFKEADFDDGLEGFLLALGSFFPGVDFSSPETALFLDEVQECGRARYAIKPLIKKTKLNVIASGSTLGVKGYNRETDGDIPTGSEQIVTMHPLDFEEFLLALGDNAKLIAYLKDCYQNKKHINEVIHEKALFLFNQYLIVGGLPEVVDIFKRTDSFAEVREKQKSLIAEYQGDFGKYVDKDGVSRTDESLRDKLNVILDVVPSQLAKENSKFFYSKIGNKARKSTYENAINWLCEFGLLSKCLKVNPLQLPLKGNSDPDSFKLYYQDSGLFIANLDEYAYEHILKGDYGFYKGAIYENIVADAFSKSNKGLYYYSSDSGLEIDFIGEYQGEVALIEVKAKSGHTKASDEILNNKNKYDVNLVIKLTSKNIGINGNKLTLPYYLAFLL